MSVVAPHHRPVDLLQGPRQTKLRQRLRIAPLQVAAHVQIVFIPVEEHNATVGTLVDGVHVR